jgi:sporulation protein YlmC with PRC-barrel domain
MLYQQDSVERISEYFQSEVHLMRKTGLILATPLLAVSLAFAAPPGSGNPLSNQSGFDNTPPRSAQGSATAGTIQEQATNQVRAEEMIGSKVFGLLNTQVAKVDDLVLDKSGKVDGVLLSVGGFLGVGEKLIAVPWEQVEIVKGHNQGDKEIIRIAMTRDQLETAPSFKSREALEAERQAEPAKRQQMPQQDQQQQDQQQQDQQAPKASPY